MTRDQYILVYCRRGWASDKFSLWLRRGALDYLTVSWHGTAIDAPLSRCGYRGGFDPDFHTQCKLTKVQGDATIMVARSAPSHKAWYRYAKRLMKGKLP